jgi:hypothetical protein
MELMAVVLPFNHIEKNRNRIIIFFFSFDLVFFMMIIRYFLWLKMDNLGFYDISIWDIGDLDFRNTFSSL